MYKLLVWLCLIALAQDGSMHSTLSPGDLYDIFGTPSPIDNTQSSHTEDGECENFDQCDDNRQIIEDGTNINNKRFNDGSVCSKENGCHLPDIRDPTDLIETNEDIVHPQEECGWRKPNGVYVATREESDKNTKFGEFPWVVAILKIVPVDDDEPYGEMNYMYAGGGSLIHREVVLTVAHVVTGNHTTAIRAGEWDTQTKQEPLPYQQRDVTKVLIHKKFNGDNLHYDIALLFLSEPLDLAPNVGLVCLPPPHQRATAGTPCIVTGWGKDKFGKNGHYQVILKKEEVPVVEHKDCQNALRRTRLGYYFQLDASFMCAGGGPGIDVCDGDGGAPLVCPIKAERDRYTQNGMVSWGIGCGGAGIPGVYVDVAFLRPWIDDQMLFRKLKPEVYIHNDKAPEVISTGTRNLSSKRGIFNKIRDNALTGYNNLENVRTSYYNPENVRTSSNNPENVRTSYNNPENVRTSSNNPENVRTSYNNPENVRTSYNNPKNVRTSSNNPENVRTSYNIPENVRTSYYNPENVRTSYNNPANVRTSYNNPKNVRTRYNNPENVRTSYNNPVNVRTRYNNPENVRTSYNNPENVRTSYNNPDNDRTRYNPDNKNNKPGKTRHSYDYDVEVEPY